MANSRKEELLAAARERLAVENAQLQSGADADSGPELLYRGKIMKASGSSGAPGSPSKRRPSGGGNGDVRAALEKVKVLFNDGLITRAEAEKKRAEILDRL